MIRTIRISGFGGQGVMLTGQLLAHAANAQGLYSLWVPTYGPETRGGTANCSVTISESLVNSPVISTPDSIIIMNKPSLDKFQPKLKKGGNLFLNTTLVKDVKVRDDINVFENGRAIRYSSRFKKEGVNVNFVERTKDNIIVTTYERGVEDETLSCGTGVTAVAIAMHKAGKVKNNVIDLHVEGGKLKVQFDVDHGRYSNVFLLGPATFVFDGKINL